MKIATWISIVVLFALLVVGYMDLNKKINQSSVVINMERLYHEFEMTKAFEKKYVRLAKERGVAIDSLNTMLQTIQSNQEQAEPIVVNQKIQKVAYAQASLQQENERMRQELEQQIWNQLNEYLYQYGKENDYPVILGAQNNGNIIYVDTPVDITDAAIEFVNLKYRGIN